MSANSPTDKVAWARVLAGDSRNFGVLYDRHRDRVFRHALGRLSHPADAEDATAIAFLELWRRRAQVRFVDDSLLPWLIVTTSNVVHNLRRSRRRYERMLARLPEPDHHPDHPDLPSNPEEALRWQAERTAKYPNGWDIPVYESDGVTQIGLFHVPNG